MNRLGPPLTSPFPHAMSPEEREDEEEWIKANYPSICNLPDLISEGYDPSTGYPKRLHEHPYSDTFAHLFSPETGEVL